MFSLPLIHSRAVEGTWAAHATTRPDAFTSSTRVYAQRLRAARLRESSSYHIAYGVASLFNKWNDGERFNDGEDELELGEQCSARLTIRRADLRALNVGVGGLPYPDTRVQAAFRAQSILHPLSAAQCPCDSASDYGRPFDARYDRSDTIPPTRRKEGWDIHEPERVLTARCACRRHEAALAVLAVEGFAPRRLTRASLQVWEENERWRALARLLGADVDDQEPVLLTREQIIQRICTCPIDYEGILAAAELGACRLHEKQTPYAPYAHLPADWAAALATAPFMVDIPSCAHPPAHLRPPPAPTLDFLDPTAALTLEEVAEVRAAEASPRLGWMPTSNMGSAHGQSYTSAAWTYSLGLSFPAPPPSPSQIKWVDLAPSRDKLAAAARHLLALDENATASRALVRAIAFAASSAEAGQGRIALAVAGTRMARCVAVDLNVVALELAPEPDRLCDPAASSERLVACSPRFQQDQNRQRPFSTPKSTCSERSMCDYGFPRHFASHVRLRDLLERGVWERVPHDLVSLPGWGSPNLLPQKEAEAALLMDDDCLSIIEMYKVRTSTTTGAPNSTARRGPSSQQNPQVPVPTSSRPPTSWSAVAPPSPASLSHTPRFSPFPRGVFDIAADLKLPESIVPDDAEDLNHAFAQSERIDATFSHLVDLGFIPPLIDFPESAIAPEHISRSLALSSSLFHSPGRESKLGPAVSLPAQSVLDQVNVALPGSPPFFHATAAPSTPVTSTTRLCRTTPSTPHRVAASASVFGAPPAAPRLRPISLPPTPDLGLCAAMPQVELPSAGECSSSGPDSRHPASKPHSHQPSPAPTTPPLWQIPPRPLPIWPPPSAPPSLPPSPALPPGPPSPIPSACTHTPCVRAIAEGLEPVPSSLQRLYDALVASIHALGDRPQQECLATAPVGAPHGPLADEVRAIARVVRRERRVRKATEAKAEEAAAAMRKPVTAKRKRSPISEFEDIYPPTPISSHSPPSPSRFASLSRWWKGPPVRTSLPATLQTRRSSWDTPAPPQPAPPCITPESAHKVAPDHATIVDELRWALRQGASTHKPKTSPSPFSPHQQGSQIDLPSVADPILEENTDEATEKVAEYEPVLAALEQAGIVVVGVHPAFMDILVREVAGVSV
ncbi:hypothetical protein CspeluHIS016_0602890 [Cutaneotrichosporon spelunceum]|uniref:Uncharacterized protein n=1 Tax=Cutaneotrichosporon spelunceum TaxID=1672016 RepID=A0AAD3TXR7_9TREE|nr:hypothetical protein CspeluHIS016_0602890 [Cutaneotrichosporon spelunceum]